MSSGYSQLMNKIGIIQILLQHFEKYVMKDEEIKSIRQLQISILKEKLTTQDVEQMVETLLQYIEEMRSRKNINAQLAHNLTLLLIDIDEYKKKFEPRLQQETAKHYSKLCTRRCESDLYICEYLEFIKHSIMVENKICDEILVASSQYLLIDTLFTECVKEHSRDLLYTGFPELITNAKLSHIQLLYEFISKVNLIGDMYQAFSSAVFGNGKKIVEAFLGDSSEDVNMLDDNNQPVGASSREKMFIPEILKYRETIQDILNSIIKASENNEHIYAFRKEEKVAFEKI